MAARHGRNRAVASIARASLVAMFRSPTAVVFSLLFPLIFIVVFGAMVDNASVNIKVAIPAQCDTANIVYRAISAIETIRPQTGMSPEAVQKALEKGQITALLNVKNEAGPGLAPNYRIMLTASNSSLERLALLQSAIRASVDELNHKVFPKNPSVADISVTRIPGRKYRPIDFILPGQLGFSLLMAGVYGSVFLLFNLRRSFVLKRFFATPVTRRSIILGELLSRLVFQAAGFIVMIALGYLVFDFTLINGLATVGEMLVFSLPGLIIFMGMGFSISGVIDNESSIAPIANTITLPQILLCGLFFPVENYPHWLQSFCKLLPLTFFVDGLRKIAFEGAHLWQMPFELAGIILWALLISVITVRVFRWD